MATISVRLDEDIRDQLEDRARGEGVSVSELVRRAIEGLLENDLQIQLDWSAPNSLSRRDRLQLSLLHKIISRVVGDPGDAEYHDRMVEVLENGYTGEYGDEFVSISEELSLGECKLVWDILDMFRVLQASAERIGIENIPGVDKRDVTFAGFDFNDRLEARMAMYAKHLIDNDRWQDMAEYFDREHEYGNSHAPRLSVYNRMLEAYRPIWEELVQGAMRGRNGFTLTAEEIADVVKSRRFGA